MMQPSLFTQSDPDYMQGELGQRFKAHHDAHPWVYEALVRLAQEWQRNAPGQKCGGKLLIERLRWEVMTSADYAHLGHRDAALNNSFVSRWVRMMIDEHPEMDAIFQRRALTAA